MHSSNFTVIFHPQCFISDSKSADGSAWSDLKQKLEALDLKETPSELETGGASKSTTNYGSDSKSHQEEIGEPSSGRSNLSDPTKVKGKDAIEASAQYGNCATDLSLHGNELASDQGMVIIVILLEQDHDLLDLDVH